MICISNVFFKKEKKVLKACQQTNAANQAKSTFIKNISHDLRTPLTGMIGVANILSGSLKKKSERELVDNLLKASHSLLRFINDVIEIATLDAGRLPICNNKFIIKSLIDDVVTLVKPAIDEKGLRFSLNYDKNIPHHVIGDRYRVYRILLSLISNAIKFTQSGYIKLNIALIKLTSDEITLKLQVEDTGIGIPFEKQDDIFSRFNRIQPSYQGDYSGSGLGLAIAKQFVLDMKGKIYVNSEMNKGSAFNCILPLKTSKTKHCQNDNEIASCQITVDTESTKHRALNSDITTSCSKHTSKPHILMVEDNKIVQLTISYQFKNLGCQVSVADTGQQALTLFQQNQYDLILMDIGLPDKDGCEITRLVRQYEQQYKQQRTPVIALTAHADNEKKQQCLHVGMDRVITKPLTNKDAMKLSNYYRKSIDCY